MLGLYKTMLCPVDFDHSSVVALRHAARLVAKVDATVHLLRIIPIIPTASEFFQSLEHQADLSARRRLQKMADEELAGIKHGVHTELAFASDIPKTILPLLTM